MDKFPTATPNSRSRIDGWFAQHSRKKWNRHMPFRRRISVLCFFTRGDRKQETSICGRLDCASDQGPWFSLMLPIGAPRRIRGPLSQLNASLQQASIILSLSTCATNNSAMSPSRRECNPLEADRRKARYSWKQLRRHLSAVGTACISIRLFPTPSSIHHHSHHTGTNDLPEILHSIFRPVYTRHSRLFSD